MQHIGAKPATKNGNVWNTSLAKMTPKLGTFGQKIDSYFFEKIKKLEYTDKNGDTKFKIRTKEALCWHIERLVAKGGQVTTDCALGYKQLGTDSCRPDIVHHDSNHSKGFAVPGPKSQALGLTRVDTSAIEGGTFVPLFYNQADAWY